MYPEFAPIAFIAALSVFLALPWHLRAGNVATLSIIGWLFISNIIYAVDAVIWAKRVDTIAPIWCDITTKIIVGANFALPAAYLCVTIHLEQVASLRLARTSFADRRRRQYIEAAVCIGLPLILMALHYIVQGHRFDIIEGYGCRPTTYFSVPGILIVWAPPLAMAAASLVFSTLALHHFMVRRVTFAAHLNASNSALTTSRYLRLMLLSILQMVWSITVTSYSLWFTTFTIPIRPWTNWADVHSDFLRVDKFPTLFIPPKALQAYYVLWWMVPISTFLFVAFFAFGQDAIDEYKKVFVWIKTRVLRISPQSLKKSPFYTLPISRKDIKPSISKPTLFSTSNTETTISMHTLMSKSPQSPSSIYKSPSMIECSDTISEISHYTSTPFQHKEPKAIGSYSDLRASTIIDPPLPDYAQVIHITHAAPLPVPSPITPPPPNPRTLGRNQPRRPQRPLTYPFHKDTTPEPR